MTSGIYKITSKSNPSKTYIGSSTNVKRRKLEHIKRLKRNEHHSIILQRHVDKYGIDDLEFSIIEFCEIDQLLIREQHYIDIINPYFNVCKIAGRTLGVKQSSHTKEKRGKAISNCWANKTQQEKDAINKERAIAHRSRLTDRIGHKGFFIISFTDDKVGANRIVYSFKCILCDHITLKTYSDPHKTKCKCMRKTSGCDKIARVKLPRHLKHKEYTHRLINKHSPYAKGITFDKASNRFRVRLKYKGKPISAGYYATLDEAIIARDKYIQDNMQHTDYKSLGSS